MKCELYIEPNVLKAQRKLLRTLIEGSSQEREDLLQGLLMMCDIIAEQDEYEPVISGDELDNFVTTVVEGWDLETLMCSAETELTAYWSTPEGREDLANRLELDDYFAKRGDDDD